MFEIFTVSSLSRKADERGGFSLARGKNPYNGNCDIRNMHGTVRLRECLSLKDKSKFDFEITNIES